jgi:hypothetical protein
MRMILKAAGAAALFVAFPALADPWDFILTNSTGKEIKTIELAPAGTTTWQPNKVDPDAAAKAFKTGVRTTVHFDKAGTQCKWDIKATFADDSNAVWSNVNVCDNSFVTLRYNPAGAPVFAAN